MFRHRNARPTTLDVCCVCIRSRLNIILMLQSSVQTLQLQQYRRYIIKCTMHSLTRTVQLTVHPLQYYYVVRLSAFQRAWNCLEYWWNCPAIPALCVFTCMQYMYRHTHTHNRYITKYWCRKVSSWDAIFCRFQCLRVSQVNILHNNQCILHFVLPCILRISNIANSYTNKIYTFINVLYYTLNSWNIFN